MNAGGDLQACGDGESRAVDDGLLADVLDGRGMDDVEAGAAFAAVEVGPDDLLVVQGDRDSGAGEIGLDGVADDSAGGGVVLLDVGGVERPNKRWRISLSPCFDFLK